VSKQKMCEYTKKGWWTD